MIAPLLIIAFFTTSTQAALFWRPGSKLLPTTVTNSGGDQFGQSVAIQGRYAVIGADQANVNPGDLDSAGLAYVFEQDAKDKLKWTPKVVLRASDPQIGDNFGYRVQISGKIIAVSAHRRESGKGAVYIFDSTPPFTQRERLEAPNGKSNDQFGAGLGLDMPYLAVGAPFNSNELSNVGGIVYTYTFNAGTGKFDFSGENRPRDSSVDDRFGWDVALSNGTFIAGAPNDEEIGSVYAYSVNAGGTWDQTGYLTAKSARKGADFGISVAIENDVAVVGAKLIRPRPSEDAPKWYKEHFARNNIDVGTAYVFKRENNKWRDPVELHPPNRANAQLFGFDVDIHDERIVISAPHGKGMFSRVNNTGKVFVYCPINNHLRRWYRAAQLVPKGLAENDEWGAAVAYTNGTLIGGARFDSEKVGAAYVWYSKRLDPSPS